MGEEDEGRLSPASRPLRREVGAGRRKVSPAAAARAVAGEPPFEARSPPKINSNIIPRPSSAMPPAKKTPAKKSAKKPSGGGEKKRKKKRVESYSSYIYKVLKQVHPDSGVSKKAMSIIKLRRHL